MSPTIFIIGNMRVVIYPKDHKPAHIHVISPEAVAKFDIETLECIENQGYSSKSIRRLKEYLESRKETLKEAWDEYQK